ncbi:Triple functional domain protein [Lepeophtheirus salmonis]|uniref:Triple functional domain protein n=1 Tax=Lepeophtheirus salmonis TaxID=72036 RepID=A0A7R8CXX2_LEPSM|nr:Triple functional domain protein [Lepeophtheirus salmonis]CAF2936194.1 Triple functional domain protein [Lepeophtheirus salmonis]
MERSSTFSIFDRRASSFRRSSVSLASNLLRRSSSSVTAEQKPSKKYGKNHSSHESGGTSGTTSRGAGASSFENTLFLKTEKWRVLAKKVLGNVNEEDQGKRPPLPPSAAFTNKNNHEDSNEASNSSSSPVGKKRGLGGVTIFYYYFIQKLMINTENFYYNDIILSYFSRWLPNIRKLSQGKLDKGGGAPSPLSGPEGGGTRHLPLIKQTSKSKIVGTSSGGLITKAPSFTTVEGMGNKSSHPSECEDDMKSSSASASTTAAIVASTSTSHEETEDVDVAEVPPPMQPISSIPPTTSTSSPPEGLDMSECSITDKGTENDSTLVCDSSSNNDKTLKGERSDTLESNDETSNSSALIQRQYRLNELLDSEKMYVKDLEQCCQYINYMKDFKEGGKDESIHMPDDLKEGKDRMIFGNIEAIYEWHRDFFSKNLEKCIQNPIELGNLFKKYDRKFQMYVVYCQNKPKSEYIVSEYIDTYFEEIRMKLGAGMLEEAEAISRAFHVMTIVPNQANDMMDIGRLQGFEGKITAQGKLLYRGPLSCLDNFSGGPIPNGGGSTAKMKPFTVFLFEQIMIFSETVGKKTQFTSPVYVYVAHFLVNKMSLEENVDDGHPCKFMIRSTDPARDALNIMCQTDEPESRDKWISIIKKQLQTQMDFLRALQAPIAYHNKLAKDYSSYDMNHLWEVVGAAREKLSSSGTVGGDEQQTSVSPPLLQQALKQQPEQHQRQSPPPAASSSMTLDRKKLHTLGRPRTRSDDFTDDKGKFNSKGIMSSYNNNQESDQESSHSSNNKLVKVLIDHEASGEGEISVLAGDMIHILSIDLQRTPHSYYISKTSDHGEELKGWVPTSIINERKVLQSPQTWSYRKFQSRSASSPIPRPRMDHNLPTKTIITTWKGPSGKDMSIFQSKKFNFVSADAGEYQCLVKYPSDEDKIKIVTFDLQVVRSCVPSRPGQPRIQDLKGSSVVLIWDYSDVMTKLSFTVEYCRLRSGHWTPVKTNINGGLCIIDNLCPGETYSFRILAVDDESVVSSQPSLPSQPLAIPLGGDFHAVGGGGNFQCSSRKIPHRTLPTNTPLESTLWKRDFERKFIELEELGRGRYSVVRRCQEILTGTESAVKFINRRKQDREITKCEYEILNSLKGHPHIVEGFELFLTSSSDAIVMEMIHYSLPLFEVLCQKTHYTEGNIQFYMTQLLKALEHIHSKGIAHLDLKPENLLLQTSTKTLKLIDFGSAQRLNDDDEVRSQNQLSTKGPEFLAPEILSENKPLGAFTDMWGFGVLIYVSLSGLSPFLTTQRKKRPLISFDATLVFPKNIFQNFQSQQRKSFHNSCAWMVMFENLPKSACRVRNGFEMQEHHPTPRMNLPY